MGTTNEAIWFCGIDDPNLLVGKVCADLSLHLSSQERADESNDLGEVDVCEWRFSLAGMSHPIYLNVDDDGSAKLDIAFLAEAERKLVFERLSSDPELQRWIIL